MRDGVDRLVVVGGDGTIHEVAGGLLENGAECLPTVAVCPVGTGNDFYRMVSPRSGVRELARLLEGGVVKRFDVGRVRWDGGERVFVNLLGVGVDVAVLRCRALYSRLPGLRSTSRRCCTRWRGSGRGMFTSSWEQRGGNASRAGRFWRSSRWGRRSAAGS